MNSLARNQIIEPKIFESRVEDDPEEWLERFELLSKLNGWSDEDRLELVQLYMGRKEIAWYKKGKSNFVSWSRFKTEFLVAFINKDAELLAWNKLQKLKQKDFKTVEDLELELDYWFIKGKIKDESVKFNCLMSTLDIKYKRKILESGLKGWKSSIDKLKDTERISRLLEDENSESNLNSKINEPVSRKVVKIHPEIESGELMYEAMAKSFEKLSLNIISKIDDVAVKIEDRIKNSKSFPFNHSDMNKPFCYFCKKEGHIKPECPENASYINKMKRANGMTNNGQQKVNSIEVIYDDNPEDFDDIFVVDKRSNETESYIQSAKKSKTNPQNEELEKIANQRTKIKRKLIPKMAENSKPYSLLDELLNTYPKINLAQLIAASPSLRNELVSLCKKVEEKEVIQLETEHSRITNCKAIVNIFGKYYWSVVDTGAACSVVSDSLLRKWGIEPDMTSNQLVVTADGSKHETSGKVSSVPIEIAGYKFPISLVVMKRTDDFLVLGTDWFVQHGVKIDMRKQELTLPIKDAEVIISLSTRSKDSFIEETEIYTIIKENIQDGLGEDIFKDDRLVDIINKNSDIFVHEIEQLSQTNVVEHKIEITENRPIKQ
ncbi:hypothetical protein AYI69_g7055, partial [Smittium culicis]